MNNLCKYFLIIAFLGNSLIVSSQEYTVKNFAKADNDQSAVTNKRIDLSGQICAIVKVLAADSIVKVDGNIIGDIQRKGSYTWIYLTDGTNRIDLHFNKHLSLSVSFPDYGINKVESQKSYILRLSEKADALHSTGRMANDPVLAKSKLEEGKKYFDGKGVEKDLKKAAQLFQEASDLGNAHATYLLGYCYEYGLGIDKSLEQASFLYEKAANEGNSPAMNCIGTCYQYGTGIQKNISKAFEWFSKAAEKGSLQAMCNLANCYENGLGVNKDITKAVEWYAKAAAKESPRGLFNYGWKLYYGKGIGKDTKQGRMLIEKAAEKGDANAQDFLGENLLKGEDGFEQDENAGFQWILKAANQNQTNSIGLLGACYLLGIGTEKDVQKGFYYSLKAAEGGNPPGQHNAAYCYYKGIGTNHNFIEAFKWCEKAAYNNWIESIKMLGLFYEDGVGVERNMRQAIIWYQKGADMGDDDCKRRIKNLKMQYSW